MRSADVVFVVGGFKAKYGYLTEAKQHIEGSFSVPAVLTDNGDRLIQGCSNYRLFLVNTNFCHQKSDIGSTGAPVCLIIVGLRSITLASVTGGVDQSRIAGHSSQHPWTQILL